MSSSEPSSHALDSRDSFHSRLGFVLAAAGSAVGLGNIWGFPTQVANHGGGAFLLVYLVVVVILAIPALYTEISLGHYSQRNPVRTLATLTENAPSVGYGMGILNVIGAVLMLSFYHIIAGWMLAHGLALLALGLQFEAVYVLLSEPSVSRDLIFLIAFLTATGSIVLKGVQQGIEAWSRRLMPLLLVLLVLLIGFIALQPAAQAGFSRYLTPDFSGFQNPQLIVSAMGQAFFSLSIGLGGMMLYGSYLARSAKLGRLVIAVAALDTLVAFMAGLLIIPALYLAMANGLHVTDGGQLIGEAQLIFSVLPELFTTMGAIGPFIGWLFFMLLSIAALTSTIGLAEVPVAYLREEWQWSRPRATPMVMGIIALCAVLLVLFFDPLFGWVVMAVTQFQLPLSGLFYFLILGWLWQRGNRLKALAQERRRYRLLFWHIRLVCPILLSLVFVDVAFAG